MLKRIIFTAVLLAFAAVSVFLGVTSFGATVSAKKKESQNTEEKKDETPEEKKEEKKPGRFIVSLFIIDDEAEKGIQKSLTEKSRQVLSVWATLKVVNGVINVLQSVQIGGSAVVEASINPMEFLSPLDKILDKISDMLLWALGAIVFEKILLAVSGYLVLLILIPVCVIISIITIWTQSNRAGIHKIVVISVFISVMVPIAIPASFYVSTLIEKKILTNNVEKVISSINEKSKTADGMERELTRLRRIGTSVISYLTNARNLSNALIEDMINFFIIFIFTNIVIPILTFFGIFYASKYFVRMILIR
jgi:hypothetical protein